MEVLRIGAPRRARALAPEVPVALVYDSATEAVMMATPQDLIDFAYGFSLTEGLCNPADIADVEPVQTDPGVDLRIWLRPGAVARGQARQLRPGPVGCGLCGRDSLDQALRKLPVLGRGNFTLSSAQVFAAVAALPEGQELHRATGAAHAAGFWDGQRFLGLREDVGRHNALDKLAGQIWRARGRFSDGALVMTSRISVDLVQKAVALGAPVLIGLSAPTTGAVKLAESLGLTLIGSAREQGFDLFTAPFRLTETEIF